MNIVSVLILVGMAVVLLLIVGVVGALRTPAAAPTPVTVPNDAASDELEARLRRLTQRQAVAAEEPAVRGTAAARSNAADDRRNANRKSTTARLPDAPRATSLRPVEPATPSSRLALPGSGAAAPAARQNTAKEGLSPLAARFTSGDDTQHEAPGPSTVRLAPPGANGANGTGKVGVEGDSAAAPGTSPLRRPRPELPGQVAGDMSRPLAARSQTRALPPDRLESAHAAAEPSGGMAAQRPSTQPIGALPPTQRMVMPRPETPPPPRPEPQGFAASADATALDIRAILRGDAVPQPVTPLTKAPTKKFTTGPLSPVVERGAPLGAVPFDPNLLRIAAPLLSQRPESPLGPAHYSGPESERVAAATPALDFDATRIMDDFDLPDAGFETHVFSTTELIESESLGFPSYTPPITPDEQRALHESSFDLTSAAPAPPFASRDATEPAAGASPASQPAAASQAGTRLGLEQMARLQPVLDELAAVADVQAVALLAHDAEPLASAGKQPVDVLRASHAAVETARIAIMEAQQLDLGACSALAVEAPAGALLLSPLPGGACLAVLLGNPARLGLLRRQVRTALGTVRSVVAESSVS